jgi:hypothetical protein
MPHVIAAHHPRPRGTLALALILATALVGCGGGDTHSEFVARLDETCTDDAARTAQLYAELEDRLRAHDYPAASRRAGGPRRPRRPPAGRCRLSASLPR